MNKSVLFVILAAVCLATDSYAQFQSHLNGGNLYSLMPDLGMTNETARRNISNANVQSLIIQFSSQNKKGKVIDLSKSQYHFNTKGYANKKVEYNRKQKLSRSEEIIYNSENLVLKHFDRNKKGDTTYKRVYTYNPANKRVNYSAYKNDKLGFSSLITYQNDTQIVKSESFEKGKLSSYWIYQFHPNGERSETKWCKANGKVKGVWTYQCKEDGVEVKKHKDTATYCIQKSTDPNGNRKEVSIKTEPDGQIHKTVHIYNPANRLVSYKSWEGINEIPEFEYSYTFLSDTILIDSDYKRYQKGQLTWQRHMEYKNGMVVRDHSQTFTGAKLKSNWESQYVFNDQGLMVQHESKNLLKESSYSQTVEYVTTKP